MPFRSLSLPVAVLGLSLAACSGEPSETEMLRAVTGFTSTLQRPSQASQ